MVNAAAAEHYAAELRAARKRKDWSQVELADRSGVAVNTIRRLENAEREPRLGQIVGLAYVLDQPASQFILDKQPGSNP